MLFCFLGFSNIPEGNKTKVKYYLKTEHYYSEGEISTFFTFTHNAHTTNQYKPAPAKKSETLDTLRSLPFRARSAVSGVYDATANLAADSADATANRTNSMLKGIGSLKKGAISAVKNKFGHTAAVPGPVIAAAVPSPVIAATAAAPGARSGGGGKKHKKNKKHKNRTKKRGKRLKRKTIRII